MEAQDVAIPPDCIETGRITVAVYSTPEGGTGTAFRVTDLASEYVLGALTFVTDALREREKQNWRLGSEGEDGYFRAHE